jgi:hypothetical protein
MHFKNEFNPIAERKPLDNACKPTVEKTPGCAFFARDGYQQWG